MSLFGESFSAHCRRSGITVEVPEGTSLLQALLDHGVPMDYSCEGGVCGACVAPLIDGEVDHLDDVLEGAARAGKFITSVSRGGGDLERDV